MQDTCLDISKEIIVFISGVPSTGKSTLSYELLKKYNHFRIIEETDIMRDVLIGYNKFLISKSEVLSKNILNSYPIFDNTKVLSFEEASSQCEIMKNSITNIVLRQKRRKISTIINGVHIIPDKLKDLINEDNVLFVNLYVEDKVILQHRLFNREPTTYMLDFIDKMYSCNCQLFDETNKLIKSFPNKFININVSNISINETLKQIEEFIKL